MRRSQFSLLGAIPMLTLPLHAQGPIAFAYYAPPSDAASVQVVFSQPGVSEMPIAGRGWENFALLTPNATPDDDTGLLSKGHAHWSVRYPPSYFYAEAVNGPLLRFPSTSDVWAYTASVSSAGSWVVSISLSVDLAAVVYAGPPGVHSFDSAPVVRFIAYGADGERLSEKTADPTTMSSPSNVRSASGGEHQEPYPPKRLYIDLVALGSSESTLMKYCVKSPTQEACFIGVPAVAPLRI